MNWFIHRMLGHYLQNEAGAEGEQAGGAAPGADPSLLGQGGQSPDFIPEKYRVNDAAGKLDLEQSSRKLAESYTHLEKRLGSGDAPPKTAEEYAPKIEAEGFDWEEFKADEGTQSFLKGAHAKGLTNAQVEFVIGEYLKAAPGLTEGAQALNTQEATTALREMWKTDQDFTGNVQASHRAVQAFANDGEGVGSFNAVMAKYGNDPDFIAFAANIGKELREDTPVGGSGGNTADFAVKASELRSQLEKMDISDPKRAALKAQLDGMYADRYPSGTSRFK